MNKLHQKILTEYISLHVQAYLEGGTLEEWQGILKEQGNDAIDTTEKDFIIYETLRLFGEHVKDKVIYNGTDAKFIEEPLTE